MAHNEDLYLSMDGSVSKRWSNVGIFKIGATLIAGACLVLLATSQGTSAAASTNLLGMSTLSRPGPMALTAPGLGGLAALPGNPAWKELAVAAVEANNRCEVGGIKPTPRFTAAFAFFSRKAPQANKKKAAPRQGSSAGYKFSEVDERAGAFPPFGYWDPLGLATTISDGQLAYYREAELKHGRICMLASLGFVVGENYHPLFGGDIDGPGLQAFTQVQLSVFWPAVLALTGGIELLTGLGRAEGTDDLNIAPALKADVTPGDIGFDPLGLKKGFVEKGDYLGIQNRELAHCRLAMIATLGMILQEIIVPEEKLYR